MEQKREAKIPRRGGDVKRLATSEHRAILRLMGRVVTKRKKSYCAGHRAYDFWNSKNVS